jgi:hypothetical protein
MGAQEEKSAFDKIRGDLDNQVWLAEDHRRRMLERVEEAEKGAIVEAIDRLADRLGKQEQKIDELVTRLLAPKE